MGIGTLRVFNHDTLIPGAVWPMHPHRDIEGITYVPKGRFRHEDSLGNGGLLDAGGVQRMTLGSGALHSECNGSETEPVEFIQMWIMPALRGLSAVRRAAPAQPGRPDQPAAAHPAARRDGRRHGRNRTPGREHVRRAPRARRRGGTRVPGRPRRVLLSDRGSAGTQRREAGDWRRGEGVWAGVGCGCRLRRRASCWWSIPCSEPGRGPNSPPSAGSPRRRPAARAPCPSVRTRCGPASLGRRSS